MENDSILRPLNGEEKSWAQTLGLVLGIIFLIGAGIATGYFLSQKRPVGLLPGGEELKIIKTEKTVGSTDVKTFRDSTEGVLEKGGIDGEGSHKLIRPGGESQIAYLTSSIVDLDQFVGKKIRVWGETFQAQKAGWLMDVGKVELLE